MGGYRKISKEEARKRGMVRVEAPASEPAPASQSPALPEPGLLDQAENKRKQVADYLLSKGKGLLEDPNLVPAFGQSFGLGTLPYASAGIDYATHALSGRPVDWETILKQKKRLYEGAEQASPAGSMMGAAALPAPGSAAGRVATAALYAGLKGALSSEGEAVEPGLAGAGTQAAMEAIPLGLGRMAKAARGSSGGLALTAAGARSGIVDALRKRGVGPEEQAALGNKFLDEGLIPSGLDPLESPTATVLKRAQALDEKTGARIGELTSEADLVAAADAATRQAAAAASGSSWPATMKWARMRQQPAKTFSPRQLAEHIEREVPLATPARVAQGGKLRELIEQSSELKPSYSQAKQQLSDVYGQVKWGDETPLSASLYREGARKFRTGLNEQLENALGPAARKEFEEVNRRFGVAAEAQALAENALSRGGQLQPFGAVRAALDAAMEESPEQAVKAGVLPFVKKALLERGPAVGAHSLRGLSYAGQLGEAAMPGAMRRPGLSSLAGGRLANYLSRPMSDDEREKESAPWFLGRPTP